jgi:hypothetical protein
MVVAMPEDESDPIASTQMFRRFAQEPDTGAAGKRRINQLTLVIGLVVLAVVLGGILVWLAS